MIPPPISIPTSHSHIRFPHPATPLILTSYQQLLPGHTHTPHPPTSFIWGVSGTSLWGEPACVLKDTPLAVVGLVLLIAGIAGLAYFGGADPSPAPPSTDAGGDGSGQPRQVRGRAVGVGVESHPAACGVH